MSKAVTKDWLAEQVEQVLRSNNFCISGTMAGTELPAGAPRRLSPELVLADGTPLEFPLSQEAEQFLFRGCQPAPFGRRRRTLVDRRVRDTEKLDGMLATMVVVLPNEFRGGRLEVNHRAATKVMRFEEAQDSRCAEFAVFYAD